GGACRQGRFHRDLELEIRRLVRPTLHGSALRVSRQGSEDALSAGLSRRIRRSVQDRLRGCRLLRFPTCRVSSTSGGSSAGGFSVWLQGDRCPHDQNIPQAEPLRRKGWTAKSRLPQCRLVRDGISQTVREHSGKGGRADVRVLPLLADRLRVWTRL